METSSWIQNLIAVLVLLSILDIRTRRIPVIIPIMGMSIGIMNDWRIALPGIFAGLLSVQLLNMTKITNVRGGDFKVMGMVGALLGVNVVFISILSAFFMRLYRYVACDKEPIPYVPFIALSTILL